MSKRRVKGTGSIYVRKDGRVIGEYEAGGKKRYISGKTKKEVAAKLAKAIADRDAGLVYDSEGMTFGEYLGLLAGHDQGHVAAEGVAAARGGD